MGINSIFIHYVYRYLYALYDKAWKSETGVTGSLHAHSILSLQHMVIMMNVILPLCFSVFELCATKKFMCHNLGTRVWHLHHSKWRRDRSRQQSIIIEGMLYFMALDSYFLKCYGSQFLHDYTEMEEEDFTRKVAEKRPLLEWRGIFLCFILVHRAYTYSMLLIKRYTKCCRVMHKYVGHLILIQRKLKYIVTKKKK